MRTRSERLITFLTKGVAGFLGLVLFRWRARGNDAIPREGPLLLLGNHMSLWDPIWAGYHLPRHVNFMASSNLFRNRLVGWYLGALGAFPKVRYVKDRDSMAEMGKRYEGGGVVCIFPEGMRTWDGRNKPVLPGIGRLIKRLDAEVVCCRITSGHMFQPRWAKWPRLVPVEVEYDPPRRFQDCTVEEITGAIDDAIQIDVSRRPEGWVWGFRMAEGLDTWLWACPDCFALQSMIPKGNHIGCGSCGKSWEVTVYCELLPDLDVPKANQRIVDHFGELPDPALLSGEGRLISQRGEGVLAEGPVRFDAVGLHVGNQLVEFADMVVMAMEVGDVLQIRLEDGLMRLDVQGQSPVMWAHFMTPHWKAARAT